MTFDNTYEIGPWYSSMSGDWETCKILVGPDCYGEEGGVKDTMTPQIHMAMIIACIHLAAVPFNFLRKISVLYPLDPLSLPQARLGSFNAFTLRIFTAACFFWAVIITHNSLDKIGSKIIVISQLIECFARASCCRMACLLFDMTIYVQQFVKNRQWINYEIAWGQHIDKTAYRKEAAIKIAKSNALKLPSYLITSSWALSQRLYLCPNASRGINWPRRHKTKIYILGDQVVCSLANIILRCIFMSKLLF